MTRSWIGQLDVDEESIAACSDASMITICTTNFGVAHLREVTLHFNLLGTCKRLKMLEQRLVVEPGQLRTMLYQDRADDHCDLAPRLTDLR